VSRFVTLEGGEGAGKSTQIRLLAEWLRAGGIDVVTTREPGGSPGAEDIRALLVDGETHRWDALTEALLHCAARHDHLANTVEPALRAERFVISERFVDSTLAYQGYGLGLDTGTIAVLNKIATGGRVPDLTIILDLPVEEGLKRANARGGSARYERMGSGFHERLRKGFLEIAKNEPQRCAVVNAWLSVPEVERAIRDVVRSRLKLKLS